MVFFVKGFGRGIILFRKNNPKAAISLHVESFSGIES